MRIPLPLARLAAFHKIAKRRFDDISSVAIGFALDVEDGVVDEGPRSGSAGSRPRRSGRCATEAALDGRPWTARHRAQAAADVLRARGHPDRRPPGQRAPTGPAMLGQSLRKLYAECPAEVSA